MARLVWTEPALIDLDGIAGYIALDNVLAAKQLVQRIFDRVEQLKDFPDSGRRPPELRNSRYREVVVGPCRVFYRHSGSDIFILYIMRTERQLRNFILYNRAESSSE